MQRQEGGQCGWGKASWTRTACSSSSKPWALLADEAPTRPRRTSAGRQDRGQADRPSLHNTLQWGFIKLFSMFAPRMKVGYITVPQVTEVGNFES